MFWGSEVWIASLGDVGAIDLDFGFVVEVVDVVEIVDMDCVCC